jgi:hypothetical protein
MRNKWFVVIGIFCFFGFVLAGCATLNNGGSEEEATDNNENGEKAYTLKVVNSSSKNLFEVRVQDANDTDIEAWVKLGKAETGAPGVPGGTGTFTFNTSRVPQKITVYSDLGPDRPFFVTWPNRASSVTVKLTGSNRDTASLDVVVN